MEKKKTRDGNHSKKTPNGTVLNTRDKYLSNKESPHEKQHREKGRAGLYRMVMVLDSNRKEELAIVELTTSKKGKLVSPLSQSRSRARPFIKTKFSDNTPIFKKLLGSLRISMMISIIIPKMKQQLLRNIQQVIGMYLSSSKK